MYRILGFDNATGSTLKLLFHVFILKTLPRATDQSSRIGRRKDFDFEHRLLMPDRSVKHVHLVAHAAQELFRAT